MSDTERKKPRITEFGPCHDEVQEIESLRHDLAQAQERVKELEELTAEWNQPIPLSEWQKLEKANHELSEMAEGLQEELAALKSQQAAHRAGQGEPVAVVNVQGDGENPVVSWIRAYILPAGSHKLYTSTPAIPEGWQLNAREIELIDGMIDVQLSHAERCDKVQNRAMAEKQKGWDMERVELLRKIKSLAAAPKPSQQAAHMPVKTYCGGKPNYCKEQE